MRKTSLLFVFLAIASAHIYGQLIDLWTLSVLTKILIIPSLALWVSTDGKPPKKYLFALFFSWLGDVFLVSDKNLFFLLGIDAFWLAQLLYCKLILIRLKGSFKQHLQEKKAFPLLFFLACYLSYFLWTIWPQLGMLRLPVSLYALTLTITGFLGLFSALKFRDLTHYSLALGGVLFVLSDSMIAFDTFYFQKKVFGPWIMITYIPAQLFIGVALGKK